MVTQSTPATPGLGDTQQQLLEALKRRGPLTLAEVGEGFDLASGTLREHLHALGTRGLVERAGSRRTGPGRPEVVYSLTPTAQALFPNREGQLLAELLRYLVDAGQTAALEAFFSDRVAARRDAALARVRDKTGPARVREVASILSEEGFMAEVTTPAPDGPPVLTLCHCPLKEAVAVSDLPCRAELALVEELLGGSPVRSAYMPQGDLTCAYTLALENHGNC